MDHRRDQRYPVRFRSSFQSANLIAGDGTVQDLSIRGCKIATSVPVQPGTALELRIRIDSTEAPPPLNVRHAVVRWFRNGTVGLEFIGLAPDEWVRLQDLVRELELQPYQRTVPEVSGA